MSVESGSGNPPNTYTKTQVQVDYRASNAEVIASAAGLWPQILIAHGIAESSLSGKHSPCPIHVGSDGFRFTDEGKGYWVCATCTGGKFKDGFNLIASHRGIDNTEAFKLVVSYLGLSGQSASLKNNEALSAPNNPHHNEQAAKLEQDQKLAKKKAAREHATKLLTQCVKHPHLYLQNKGINQPALINTTNYKVTDKQTVRANALLIPIYDIANQEQLIGAQFINSNGSRAYLAGTPIADGIHILKGDDNLPYVGACEGYATGLSLFMATGATIVVVFDANGMEGKAERLKASFPGKFLVFFGDTDANNVGQKAAHAAALKTNGLAIIPPEAGDWNDYHQAHSLAATKDEIDRQLLQLKAQRSITKDVDIMNNKNDVITSLPSTLSPRKINTRSQLPKGFKFTDDELVYEKKDKDGEIVQEIPVASRIEVAAKQCDLYTSGNTGLTLEFINLFEKPQKWAMPRSLLSDEKSVVTMLCGLGATILDKRLFNQYLMQSNPDKSLFCVNVIGWHSLNNSRFFVLPTETIGHSPDKEKIVYQSETLDSHFKTKSTIDEWRENIGKYCSGNSRLIFGVSHGLASTLLHLTQSTNGGINFFGQSSTGKTTIAQVCVSLFGDPSYLLTCRTTTNAAEKLAHSRNDCLLVLDELAQMEAKELGNTIYTLGNGKGKERMLSGGELRPCLAFRCNYLFTGEIPVSQRINEGGDRETEGQLVRVLDIPAVVGEHGVFDCLPDEFKSGAEFSNHLKEQCSEHYGTCALAFLEEVTKPENLSHIKEKLEHSRQQLIENLPQGIQGQTERAINRFALAACAGELATEWGLTGWQHGDAITSARKCLDAWLAERGGVENQERNKLLTQVKEFFEKHGDSRFTDKRTLTEQDILIKTHNRAGIKELIKQVEQEYIYYVFPSAFKEMHAGFTRDFAIKTLMDACWLESDKSKQKKFNGQKGDFYIFNQTMWG